MKELLETLDAWEREGVGAGRAVVVRTFGSAPRPEGAVLLRADDGRIAGSVSGGCVEGAAAEEIERARADGHARVIRYGISDEQAWDVGLACGGTIDVLVEPVAPAEVVDRRARSLARRAGRGRRHAAPRRLAAGRVRAARAGRGAPPEPSSSSTTTAGSTGTLGCRRPRRAARRGRRATRSLRGPSRTVELGGRSALRRGVPGPAAARDRRRGRGRPVARPARPRARLRDRRRRRPGVVRDAGAVPGRATGSSSAGPTRSPTRSASARTTRSRS